MSSKSLPKCLLAALLTLPALALAVGDMPGGPKVNQLDLHTPVTAIAQQIQGLHYFMVPCGFDG